MPDSMDEEVENVDHLLIVFEYRIKYEVDRKRLSEKFKRPI